MKKKQKKIFLLLSGLIILGSISTLFRVITLLTAFDSLIGYYDDGAFITTLNRIFLIITTLYGAVLIAISKKDELPSPKSHPSTMTKALSFITAFAFVMSAVLLGITYMIEPSKLLLMTTILLILSAGYFICKGAANSIDPRSPLNLFAIGPIAASVSIILIEMFDMYVPINGPEKTCLSFGLLAASLFIVETARNDTGTASPKLHLYSIYLSCFLCAYSAIPGLIAALTGVTNYTRFTIYYFILIAMLLYTIGTLIDHTKVFAGTKIEETEEISGYVEDQPTEGSETEE